MKKRCLGCMELYEDNFEVCPHCGYIAGSSSEEVQYMNPGTLLQDRYLIGRALGSGGFGVTYLAWDEVLEHKVAIKEYLPGEFSVRTPGQTQVTIFNGEKTRQFHDGMNKFIDEAKRLAQFTDTEGIVHVYDSFEENGTAYIIMEYLEGETLTEKLNREGTIPYEEAVALLTPVIHSLSVVHEKGIIHRDIAPDNIFITKEGNAKLLDFGAARYATTSHSRSLTVIIKEGYSPEEQYRSRGDQGSYTDVYALGATLYKMITGICPPDAMERRVSFETKKKDLLESPAKLARITTDQENAILNAMNNKIEDRTQNMDQFYKELTSEQPVKRNKGTIKKIDVLQWPLWAKIGVPVLTFAIVVFSVLFGSGVIGFASDLKTQMMLPEGMSRVPAVVNKQLDDAEKSLERATLQYMIAGKEYSNGVKEDCVLKQSQEGGMLVEENTQIELTVSGGKRKVEVPDVEGLLSKQAVKQLKELGFKVKMKKKYDEVLEAGTVIKQDVEYGELYEVGETIELTISKGSKDTEKMKGKTITIPHLKGKNIDDISSVVKSSHITIRVAEYKYSDKPEGTILRQSIKAGEKRKAGTSVHLVVSMGEHVVTVGDYTYFTEKNATAMIKKSGLKPKIKYVKSDEAEKGVVLAQNRTPGDRVKAGSTIILTVSSGGNDITIKNVYGETESKARSILQQQGFIVSVSYIESNKEPGTVIHQSPHPHLQAKKGSRVMIYVSVEKQTKLVTVPNVENLTKEQAIGKLKAHGFSVVVGETTSYSDPYNNVISQSPHAGDKVPKGSRVVINVNKYEHNIPDENIGEYIPQEPPSEPSQSAKSITEISLNQKQNICMRGDKPYVNVTLKYKDGSTRYIEDAIWHFSIYDEGVHAQYDTSTVGTKTVCLRADDCQTCFTVKVVDKSYVDIENKFAPPRSSQYAGTWYLANPDAVTSIKKTFILHDTELQVDSNLPQGALQADALSHQNFLGAERRVVQITVDGRYLTGNSYELYLTTGGKPTVIEIVR